MQNWEVLQKKISEMSKDAFITFAKEKLYCDTVQYMLGVNVGCGRCKYRYESGSADCKKVLLEDEYQPPKQEKWIVHRTLRMENKEVYIGFQPTNGYLTYLDNGEQITSTEFMTNAYKYDFADAVEIRDKLNKTRVGKQYLWVISKVEE